MTILSQRKYINSLFLVALIILIASGYLVYKQVQRMNLANAYVAHTLEVIGRTNHLQSTINDTESRLTYYVITNNKQAVKNIPQLIETIHQDFAELKSLTKDNPIQQQRLNAAAPLIETKMARMKEVLTKYTYNATEAMQLVSTSERLEIKEKIAQLLMEINQYEISLLQTRTENLNTYIKESNWLLIGTSGLAVTLFLLSLALLNHYIIQRNQIERRREEAENQLVISNAQLQQSEERFKLATEGSNAGLWDWKPGTDEVFFSNHFKKLLGYTDEEFPNSLQSFERVIHPDDHDGLWMKVNKHLENHEPFQAEYRLKTKSGYKWFQAAGQAVWDKKNKPLRMSGSIIDITERRQANTLLGMQYTITRLLMNTETMHSISTKIIQTICEDLELDLGALWMLESDKKTLTCIGYWQKPSMLDQKFQEATNNSKVMPGNGIIGQIWETGEITWIENILEEPDFTRQEQAKIAGLHTAIYLPLLIKDEIIGVLEFFSKKVEPEDEKVKKTLANIGFLFEEFIKRRESEHHLKESEKHKTAILESALDSIITIDQQGKILLANPQTTKIFNYQIDDLLNKNINILLPDLLKKIFDIGKNVMEFTGIKKSGETFPCELTISKMTLNKEQMFVIIIRDITERKKIDKMKNEFISIVSHELRTPLTSIQGSLDLLADGTAGPLSDDAKELTGVAKQNSDRLIRLINDILDIEKIESGKMEFKLKLFSVDDLVEETISANQSYAKKFGVKLRLAEKIPGIMVNVDHDKFLQALTNLVSNAIKFSPANEEVTVSISKQSDKFVRIMVTDKGPGISTEFQSRIFQKFVQEDSTASRKKGGTGLGLSITKAIIDNFHGSINFKSDKHGSIFYFDLPIASIKTQTTENVVLQKKPTILICEYDGETAQALQSVFSQNQFNTIITHSPESAKQILMEKHIDALAVDLVFPNKQGINLIKDLRSTPKTQHLPIVVISISARDDKKELTGSALSLLDWIEKPVEPKRLMRAINFIKSHISENTINILYIEDDQDLINIITKTIQPEAEICSVNTLADAQEQLKKQSYDLVILDLVLPDGSGIELLPELAKKRVPVIIFSAYEFPEDYAHYVKSALIKSKTSNKELLEVVKQTLKKDLVGG